MPKETRSIMQPVLRAKKFITATSSLFLASAAFVVGPTFAVAPVFALTPAPPRISLSQEAAIPIPGRISGIAAGLDGQTAYVTETDKKTVTLLDLSGKIVQKKRTSTPIGAGKDIAISPDGKNVYLPTQEGLAVLDPVTLKQVSLRAYPRTVVTPPEDVRTIALSGDGKTVYVALRDARVVATFTVDSEGVGQSIVLDGRPQMITAGKERAYVLDDRERVVSIQKGKAEASKPLSQLLPGEEQTLGISDIAVSKDETALYLAAARAPGVIRIPTADLSHAERLVIDDVIKPAAVPHVLAPDLVDGTVLYIGAERNGRGEVLAVDVRTGQVLSSRVQAKTDAPADLSFVLVADRLLAANGKAGNLTPYRVQRTQVTEEPTIPTNTGTVEPTDQATGKEETITKTDTSKKEDTAQSNASGRSGLAIILISLGGVGLVTVAVFVFLAGLKRRRERVGHTGPSQPSSVSGPGNAGGNGNLTV